MNNFWWLVFLFLWGLYGIAFGKKPGFFIGLFLSFSCLFFIAIWTVYDPVDLLPHTAVLSLCLTTAIMAFRNRTNLGDS